MALKENDKARINVNTKTPGALDVELFKQELAYKSKRREDKGKTAGEGSAVD
ncbi:hypothetical protein [Desulfofalx alkaliphila]|uniref:hypothetical protein n=1 Tax=Desulfofalx alkaliphila TaxID=105483 RepID=UPI000AE54DBA|nr:hypothetical protein [Desulfofalx alkaliphila]